MNLIVAKTRKNDVSNTNGVFAAAHESVHDAVDGSSTGT